MSTPVGRARSHPASKREHLLDQTFVLVGEQGYRGLSFQLLADRCGLTKQGVLHYFPTKTDLLRALLDERDASIEHFLLDQLSSAGFDEAAVSGEKTAILRESLIKVVEHMIAIPGLIRLHVVLRAEAIATDHPARDYFLHRDRATLAWLVERMSDLLPDPIIAARRVLAVMLGLQQQWLQEDCNFDLLSEWRLALTQLLRS